MCTCLNSQENRFEVSQPVKVIQLGKIRQHVVYKCKFEDLGIIRGLLDYLSDKAEKDGCNHESFVHHGGPWTGSVMYALKGVFPYESMLWDNSFKNPEGWWEL